MALKGLKDAVAATLPEPAPGKSAEQVTQRVEGDVVEARSTSRRIRTVDDLLAHIQADMSKYAVAASEATKWECSNAAGEITELHRVFVRLKPKAGPSVQECVESLIDAAKKQVRRAKVGPHKRRSDGLLQLVVVSDTHFGKYAWSETTGGGDYDLQIARKLVDDAASELLAVGNSYKPARRAVCFLGDLFHYDNPNGQTTSGTQLERDGRLQKMIEVGCDSLLRIVEQSAQTAPTDVYVVNGNHDETLTWAFHRILMERFNGDRRVAVSKAFTSRQYFTFGRNLIGLAHGNKAKRKLPQIMALEAAGHWAACPYREYHTGHFHSQATEWQRPIETIDGVIVRTAPAICPIDDWHSDNGFIGSRQAMETFLYRPSGGLSAMHVAGPA